MTNKQIKDDHYYSCLQIAARNVWLDCVQEIIFYQEDGKNVVWC